MNRIPSYLGLLFIVSGVGALLAVGGVYYINNITQTPQAPAVHSQEEGSIAESNEGKNSILGQTESPSPPLLTKLPAYELITAEPPTETDTSKALTPTQSLVVNGITKIGESENGQPIEIYSFGTGTKLYLVVAGTHGGYEINTVVLADKLINYFSENLNEIPEGSTLLILRVLNPDGLKFSNLNVGRPNANNVDLNRNFPFEWSPLHSTDGCKDYGEITTGAYPGSESETWAFIQFFLAHSIQALVSYHSSGPGIYPAINQDYPGSEALAKRLSSVSGYPYPGTPFFCEFGGELTEWAASLGIPAVDVELTDHWNIEFANNLKLVKALLEWKP